MPLDRHGGRLTLAAAVREGLQCRFVIEERMPGSCRDDASGNRFLFRLLGVEAIDVVPAGTDMAAAMQRVANGMPVQRRRTDVMPAIALGFPQRRPVFDVERRGDGGKRGPPGSTG